MTWSMPSKEEFKPLLKTARKCSGAHHARQKAVALYNADGELIGGPKMIVGPGRVDWSRSGIEVSAAGPFTSYDDLRQSWSRKKSRIEARERARRK